jgi:hypothetical protein
MSGDEASSALATSQFLGWLAGRLWADIGDFAVKFRNLFDRFSTMAWESKWRRRAIWLLVVSVGMFALVGATTHGFDGNSIWVLIGEAAGSVFLALMSAIILFSMFGVLPLLTIGFGALLFLIVAIPVSIATFPFGPELVLTGFFVEVTSEVVPPGSSYVVHTFNPHSGPLSHAQIYENEPALNVIVDWISRSAKEPMNTSFLPEFQKR